MVANALASRTCDAAAKCTIRCRCASQDDVDRWPSRAKEPRRSNSANRRAFGLDDPGCTLELIEVRRQPVVAHESQILDSKLLECRTKCRTQGAHDPNGTEHVFDAQ
jgi:hypothetical protein